MEGYQTHLGLEEFSAAREHFDALVKRLGAKEMTLMDHGEVKDLIMKEGWSLLRLLLQGHLDLRASQEPRREYVRGTDGVSLNHCRTGLHAEARIVVRRGHGEEDGL
jgi:hypothetical protein